MVIEAVIFVITLLVISLVFRKKRTNAPGPKGYPIIGNTMSLDGNNMNFMLDHWAVLYGDVYKINILGRDVIVLSSFEKIRAALVKEPNATIFADRAPGFAGKEFFFNYHDIGFARWNPETIRRRKLGYRLMKAYGEGMVNIEKYIHEQLEMTVSKLQDLAGKEMDPEVIVDEFLCGVITTLFTGRAYDCNSELVSTMKTFDHLLSVLVDPWTDFILYLFPFLKHAPCKISKTYHQCKYLQQKFLGILRHEVENGKIKAGICYELYAEKSTNVDANGNQWITSSDINGILTDLFSASFLTSKATLLSLLHCIISNPHVQTLLQAEVDAAVPKDRMPNLNDRVKMPYAEAVILETLRLATNTIPFPRCVIDNTTVEGIFFPKGTAIVVNLWTVHHNKSIWKDPYKFNPDRFLDDSGRLLDVGSVPMRNMMAFGVGKRSCIGEAFAKSRIFLFLATMMKHFTFTSKNIEAFHEFDPFNMKPGLVRMPQNFKFRVEQR